ncbi:hypothetical protein KP509_21G065300 [Ceratopteris richardii]|uniref:Protein HGH1 homolog n=1 Tax=Ceratopteris richardii TaxID=49495 RepID=A0A8T2SEE0_CERRI|nr:hypothetical protein KP509_21G065300 [Ceratopteris richardii]
MATELDELIGFLSSPSPQEARKSIIEALVNLSQVPKLGEFIIQKGGIEKSMELIGGQVQILNQLLTLLIVNLTQSDLGVKRLLQEADKLEGLYVRKLVRLFSKASEGVEDYYEHVASILVNVTQRESGRRLILDPKKGLLKQILPHSDSTSLVRRKGVISTVRNCCFEAENELASILSVSQYLWPALLLPLAGKQIFRKEDTSKMPLELANPLSHERESEGESCIRIEAAEALYLIARHEGGRKALWSVNGPRILQIGYEDEEDHEVMEAYERLGSLLVNEGIVHES